MNTGVGIRQVKQPLIVNSDSEAGAINVSPDGSRFEVLLDTPLIIPTDAENVYIEVQNVTVWWNFHNIQEGINDQLFFEYNTVNYVFTFPGGLYDLDHIIEELERQFIANSLPTDLFSFTPNLASNKIVVEFNYGSIQIDFSNPRNFAEILGFNQGQLVPPAPSAGILPQYQTAPNIAQLNQVEYLLIHSDLVSRGIRINNRYNSTIAQVSIDVDPGLQIIYRPFQPPSIPAPELVGQNRKQLRFWLTDQNDNDLNTRGETWSVRLVIHYDEEIKIRPDFPK